MKDTKYLFRRVRWYKDGYAIESVNAFFESARAAYESEEPPTMTSNDVRRAAFKTKRGGYNPRAVDRAMDRLESAFASREREEFIETHGESAWLKHLGERAQSLYPRLVRKRGERFAAAPRGLLAYDCAEVDALLDRITAFFDQGEPLEVDEIRLATFTRRFGIGGYAEGPVDAFLDRTVEVLLAVDGSGRGGQ